MENSNKGLWFIIQTPSGVNYRLRQEGIWVPAIGTKCLFAEKLQVVVNDVVYHLVGGEDGELTCVFVYVKPDGEATEKDITAVGFERRDF